MPAHPRYRRPGRVGRTEEPAPSRRGGDPFADAEDDDFGDDFDVPDFLK
jgi:hypothetical protein